MKKINKINKTKTNIITDWTLEIPVVTQETYTEMRIYLSHNNQLLRSMKPMYLHHLYKIEELKNSKIKLKRECQMQDKPLQVEDKIPEDE